MSAAVRQVILAGMIFVAFVVQTSISGSAVILGAKPNLGLCMLLTGCLFVDANGGAALGFFLGLLEGSFVSFYVGSFIVTRTLAGYSVGLLEQRIYRENILVALSTVLIGTAMVELCFFLFAPQAQVTRWAIRASGESLCNGALAIPLFFVVRRVVGSRAPK